MKKFFIIAVAALAASAACSKVETFDNIRDREVKFLIANYAAQTRAEVSVLSDFEAFQCKAFLHAEGVDLNDDYSVKTTTTYQNFFGSAGEKISWNSSDAEWAPSHTYYWPKSTHSFVNFVGWYGTTDSTAEGAKSNITSSPTVGYSYVADSTAYVASLSWPFTSSLGAAGSNLLYADVAWRYNANDTTPQYGKDGVTEGVPMLFHHALAQLNIKVYADTLSNRKSGADSIYWSINLLDVEIGEINSEGTLSLLNADPGRTQTKSWTGGWSGTDTAAAVAIDDSVSGYSVTGEGKSNATDLVAATCVLPQNLTGVELTFKLKIVTNYSGSNSNTEIIPITIPVDTAFSGSWDMNKKYTWYIRIVPSENEVLFDPALEEDWDVVADAEYNLDDQILP